MTYVEHPIPRKLAVFRITASPTYHPTPYYDGPTGQAFLAGMTQPGAGPMEQTFYQAGAGIPYVDCTQAVLLGGYLSHDGYRLVFRAV